jgi:hypothetical protein
MRVSTLLAVYAAPDIEPLPSPCSLYSPAIGAHMVLHGFERYDLVRTLAAPLCGYLFGFSEIPA